MDEIVARFQYSPKSLKRLAHGTVTCKAAARAIQKLQLNTIFVSPRFCNHVFSELIKVDARNEA
jgi:hypothetical protein